MPDALPPAAAGWILLFNSIHHVLSAEQALKQRSLWCDLIPVPRDLHSDCGMVITFREHDWPAVHAAMLTLSTPRPRLFRVSAAGPVELPFQP